MLGQDLALLLRFFAGRQVIALLCLLLSITTTSSVFANKLPNHIGFKHILEEQDIAVGVIRDIIQDKDGFIWIGGDGALLRYDGYEIRDMSGPNKAGEKILGVYEFHADDSETLWIATANGLVEYNLENNSFETYTSDSQSKIRISNDFVSSVSKSPNGEILIATPVGLNAIDAPSKTVTIFGGPDNENPLLINNHTWTTFIDSKNNVWVGTMGGATRIDWASKKSKHFRHKNHEQLINNNEVRCLFEDNESYIWMCTMNGLNQYDPSTGKISRFAHEESDKDSIGSNQIWSVHQDHTGLLWIGTDHGGLNLFDKDKKRFIKFKHNSSTHDSIGSNTIRKIYEDNSGDLWLGLYPTGVNLHDRSTSGIEKHTKRSSDSFSLSHSFVFDIIEDQHNNYWIATDGGGLNYFNRKTGTYKHFRHSPNDANTLSGDAIISLELDRHDQLWIGTWGAGLNRMDLRTQKITRFPINSNGTGTASLHIWDILETQDGNIWLATQGAGINKYDPKTQKFSYYPPNHPHEPQSLSNDTVWNLFEDSHNNLWVASNGGLNLMDRENETFTGYFEQDGNSSAISSDNIEAVHEDKDGNLWFGTRHGLNLFHPETQTFTSYDLKDGIADQFIYSITEDISGKLWLGTANGISTFDRRSKKFVNYHKNDSWQSGAIRIAKKLPNNELVFGGAKGFLFVNPQSLTSNKHIPPIVLTDFKLFTESLLKTDKFGILSKSLNYTNRITLDHSHSMFSIEFSALNFRDPHKNQYAYKLEGFDKEWREIDNRRTAIYTNLDPGIYTFRVKGSNNDGVWNNVGRSITIEQTPPPWRTWWAYCCYIILIILFFYWLVHQKTEKLKFEKELQEKTNLKLVKLDKMKSNFMANTSHELLTPLNGIVGLSEFLEEALRDLNSDLHGKASMIVASGRRLSSLVYDIIDFSNISENKLALQLSPLTLHKTVEQAFDLLRPMLEGKRIQLINMVPNQKISVLADPNRLQHILGNLISNAIKYSEKGDILVSANIQGEFVEISVEDHGIGIDKKDQAKIFNAFDQLDDSATRLQEGAGLGLALTKRLVELHGGEIQVKSTPGQGSCFSFTLHHYNKPSELTEIVASKESSAGANDDNYHQTSENIPTDHSSSQAEQPPAPLENPGDYNVMIVDDDAINRMVLKGILKSGGFNIIEAESGPEAIKIIEKQDNIDLVILDVMMPKMTGFEVCTELRKTYPMYDLPIIFLTAKTSEDAMIEGMEAGGNDFLVKPTSKSILLPKVENLIKLSAQLRNVVK